MTYIMYSFLMLSTFPAIVGSVLWTKSFASLIGTSPLTEYGYSYRVSYSITSYVVILTIGICKNQTLNPIDENIPIDYRIWCE